MFEDSLVESTGRIRTHSKRWALGSFAMQGALLTTLILLPYFYPASLPRHAFSSVLVAPLPPAAPPQILHAQAIQTALPAQLTGLIAPRTIPQHILSGAATEPAPGMIDSGREGPGNGNVQDAMSLLGSTLPSEPRVVRAKPPAPLRVSAGVAEGQLLTPIQPIYPAIAKTAGIQGTVVIEAVISKEGVVNQTHAVSGPPMLMQAALASVNRARYKPYKLNGTPVEVETTINIVFSLSD